MFFYAGEPSASKSLFNRALILQHHFPQLQITGQTQAEDVLHLQAALKNISASSFNLGEGGTTLRFFLLCLSRYPGSYELKISEKLSHRPFEEIESLAQQLQFQVTKTSDTILLKTQGWKSLPRLQVSSERSSQFASAVLLNCWNLPFDFEFETSANMVSEPYFDMTLKLCQSLGLEIQKNKNVFFIRHGQQLKKFNYHIEPDMSSAFTLACCAVAGGEVELQNCHSESLQPDFYGFELLKQMGAQVEFLPHSVKVKKTLNLKSIRADINKAPDLFPCLAAVCAQAEGVSIIHGAEHLKYKESNRIAKVFELLSDAGSDCAERDDGIEIKGPIAEKTEKFKYNPENDHRLAFAAQVLKLFGFEIEVTHPEVVNKSFPDFWKITEQPK